MPHSDDSPQLRNEIERLIGSGRAEAAVARLAGFWRDNRDLATATFVCSRFEKLRGMLPLIPHRLAILRSFTVEPLIPLLRAEAFCAGIDLTVHLGDFNAYSQEILDGAGALYSFSPNSVILAVRTPDIAPELWDIYAEQTTGSLQEACVRVSSSFAEFIRTFRERSSASLIVHNLEEPARPSAGVLDAQSSTSQSELIRQINREIAHCASEYRGVYILDYNALQARHGRRNWQDDRKYSMARLPISGENLIHLVREWLRFLVPLSGKIAKALVVDLDNTLWEGIVGEDGFAGIKVGPEHSGAPYYALQRAILDLTHRGILLAVCSKNNLDDAMEVLENHRGMLLRPQHFAATRINWNDKAQSLREIATELNIGTDSLAFLDDNPAEREQVGAALPEITVIDLPSNPFEYANALRESPVLERLSLSSEDRERNTMYAVQRERSKGEQQFQSKEDFYRFLDQQLEIAPPSQETLSRIAQLTQKTNQFNLTTRRYTGQQISELCTRKEWTVLAMRVRDRFGDQGLVGVCITHDEDRTCEIDTFLMSCRVIGRTVETAFLSALANAAIQRGCNKLTGYFIPTKKNAPCKDFYSQNGFQLHAENGDGSRWALDLADQTIPCPGWIKLKIADGDHN